MRCPGILTHRQRRLLCCRFGELRSLLPEGVAGAVLDDLSLAAPLFASEARFVDRACPRRVREFAAGRSCARQALMALGRPPQAIPVKPDRSPAWPMGIIGSISHTATFAIAVAGAMNRFAGLGIDAEDVMRVDPDVWHLIAGPDELHWIHNGRTLGSPEERACLLFTAKEAFYKAQYCITGAWLGFHDVECTMCDEGFRIRVKEVPAGLCERSNVFSGRYIAGALRVVSLIGLPSERTS